MVLAPEPHRVVARLVDPVTVGANGMPNAIDHGVGHLLGIGAEQPQQRHHDEIRAILPRIDGGERRLDDAVEAFWSW